MLALFVALTLSTASLQQTDAPPRDGGVRIVFRTSEYLDLWYALRTHAEASGTPPEHLAPAVEVVRNAWKDVEERKLDADAALEVLAQALVPLAKAEVEKSKKLGAR